MPIFERVKIRTVKEENIRIAIGFAFDHRLLKNNERDEKGREC